MSLLRPYLIAVHCFTRIPVSGALAQRIGGGPDTLRASAAHLPGVGWLAGLVACTAFALLGLALPESPYAPLAAAVACTIATVLLTGAVHESALVHVANGLGSAAPREQALAGRSDSPPGSQGALAVTLALLAKVTLLAVLAGESPAAVLVALLAAHVVSRFWPLLLRNLPDGAAASTAAPWAARIDGRTLAIGTGWCIAPVAVALLAQPAAFTIGGVALSGVALFGMRRLLARRLQGFTADSVGATQQVCEIAFYLGAAAGLAMS
jgi:adenosylcobinamide-GDP ribazoletransferase